MKALFTKVLFPAGLAAAIFASGCASSGVKNPSGVSVTHMNADEQGFVAGTGPESQDLVSVADKMARSILSIPQIANAPSPPTIVLQPVVNKTRFPFNQDMFLTYMRAQLNQRARGKVMFLDREQMANIEKERNLKREGAVTSSTDPGLQQFKGADYFLTGTLEGLSTHTSQGTSDYIQYAFRLTDVPTSVIVWEDIATIKKQGLEDAAYR